jgi:hypothetical protein
MKESLESYDLCKTNDQQWRQESSGFEFNTSPKIAEGGFMDLIKTRIKTQPSCKSL